MKQVKRRRSRHKDEDENVEDEIVVLQNQTLGLNMGGGGGRRRGRGRHKTSQSMDDIPKRKPRAPRSGSNPSSSVTGETVDLAVTMKGDNQFDSIEVYPHTEELLDGPIHDSDSEEDAMATMDNLAMFAQNFAAAEADKEAAQGGGDFDNKVPDPTPNFSKSRRRRRGPT